MVYNLCSPVDGSMCFFSLFCVANLHLCIVFIGLSLIHRGNQSFTKIRVVESLKVFKIEDVERWMSSLRSAGVF